MMEFKPFNREMGIAGAVFLLVLSLSLIPQLTALMVWFLPFPIISFSVLQPRIYAIGLSVLSGLVLVFTGLGWFAVLFAIALYFLAWAVGETLTRENSPFLALVTMTLVFIMLELVLLALFRWSGVDIFSSLKAEMAKSIAQESTLLGAAHTDTKTLLAQTLAWIRMMFPALLSLLAFVFAGLNLILLRWLLKAQISIPPLLRNWKLPYSVLSVYLVSLALILLNAFKSVPWLWQSLHNLEFIGSFLIGLQGIAFIWRKLQPYRARYLVVVMLLLAALIQLVSMVYVVMGVLDILNDSRRSKQSK